MTKLSLIAILALIFFGVTRFAQFILALFVIVFFGVTTYELLRALIQPAKQQYAA